MFDVNDTTDDLIIPDELETLKARATQLGITFHPTIGLEKLRVKVNNKINGEAAPTVPDAPDETPVVTDTNTTAAPVITPEIIAESMQETKLQRNARLKAEASKLVRVRVTCMNENKKAWNGELFTCANSVVGTHKKFVPFNVDEGFHVPQIILNVMNTRRCQIFVTTKNAKGRKVVKPKLIKEFAIEIMEPLTIEELQKLEKIQAMSGSVETDED